MSIVFTKPQINGLMCKNRIMRSATYEAMADEHGFPTPRLTQHYVALSQGGCGLIVSGGVYTEMRGRTHRTQLGLMNDQQQDAIAKMIEAVHENKGLIMLQLNHGGASTRKEYIGGLTPLGPSKVSKFTEAMTKDDIMRTIEGFISAAKRTFATGADGIQLHAAHGYLLGQFISPIWNKREDDYGGSVAGRFRIVKEIVEGMRSVLPSPFAISIKMNGHDIEQGGVTLESAIETAKLAELCGVDMVEISSGSGRKPYSLLGDTDFDYCFKDPKKREQMKKKLADIHFKPMFNLEYAREIKKHVKIPVASVGGFRKLTEMEEAIKSGACDIVSLSRAFIREPSLVNDLKFGKIKECSCISCNRCFFAAMAEKPCKCLQKY